MEWWNFKRQKIFFRKKHRKSSNYSGRFAVLPHAQLPSLQPTRVNRSFTKYEAVYNVSMLGLSCAINCNSRNGERSCFLAVSMTECITAYASAPRNVRKSPATFCFVFAGLTARSLALLSYGTSGLSRKGRYSPF